jgi:hypothetical protein
MSEKRNQGVRVEAGYSSKKRAREDIGVFRGASTSA